LSARMPVQVTTLVYCRDFVGKQTWRWFGRIIRRNVGVFHPCIAMLNPVGLG